MQGGRVVCFSQQMAAAKNHAAVAVYPAERFFLKRSRKDCWPGPGWLYGVFPVY
jgi:hypothetical protein